MYVPYPIYDIKTGLYLAKEPWISPPDAFSDILNAQLRNGRIDKRKGYARFGEIVHQVRNEYVGASGGTSYSGVLTKYPVRPGDPASRFCFTDGTQIITDNGDGTLGGDGTGTIDYETGAYSITFNSTTSANVTADYQFKPGHPVVGIYQYYDDQGNSSLIAFDTRRANVYFPLEGKFHDVTETDVWSGDPKSFVWAENWQSRLFVTNNRDRIQVYDGNTFSALDVDVDGDGNNDADTCLLIFGYKGHLLLMNTYENGVHYPQRARWSAAGDWTEWRENYGGGFVDAPAFDWIVAADFFRNDLIVFFERSVWKLVYAPDPALPFRWEKVADTEGAYATFSVLTFSDEIIALGPTALVTTDGISSDVLGDDKIPDIALSFNQDAYSLCYGAVLEELREAWITYPSIGADRADRVLSLNYLDDTWGIYDLSVHSIGYYYTSVDPTWDNVDLTWDEIEFTWDEKETQAGYPITLGGMYDGTIVTLNSGGSDNGAPIELRIKTARLNPFWKEGRRARLGKVEFLVDTDADFEITVRFYRNFELEPYKEVSFTCDGVGDKTWKSVFCGEEADFHMIEIHNNQPYTIRIHAVVPYFKPAGVVK